MMHDARYMMQDAGYMMQDAGYTMRDGQDGWMIGMRRMVVLLNNLRKSAESAEGIRGVGNCYERNIRDA